MKKAIIWIFVIVLILAIAFGLIYVTNINKHENKLTLEVICNMVAEKKEQLTWSDFEKYPSADIGHGLYILLYEIDENYELRIGGVPNEEPMYIRLVFKNDNEKYIDIRYENIEDFLNMTK